MLGENVIERHLLFILSIYNLPEVSARDVIMHRLYEWHKSKAHG